MFKIKSYMPKKKTDPQHSQKQNNQNTSGEEGRCTFRTTTDKPSKNHKFLEKKYQKVNRS